MMPKCKDMQKGRKRDSKRSPITIKSRTRKSEHVQTKISQSKQNHGKTNKINIKESRKRTKDQLKILESFYE